MTEIIVFREKQEGQECIPVGCVLTAVVTARGSLSRGVCVWGGLCLGEVSLQSGDPLPAVDRQTLLKILPSVVVGKN